MSHDLLSMAVKGYMIGVAIGTAVLVTVLVLSMGVTIFRRASGL